MKSKLTIVLNMLSPYWIEPFDQLSKKGWDITIIVAAEKEKDREYAQNSYKGRSFQVCKSKSITLDLSSLQMRTRYLHFQFSLWKDLKHSAPNIIISNELGLRTITARVYGKYYNVPVVPWICVSEHTERKNSWFRNEIRKLLVRNVPSVCTNMTEAEKYLTNTLRISKAKIFRTPYAISTIPYYKKVQESKKSKSKLRESLRLHGRIVIYVGQMIKRKGIYQLSAALKELDSQYHEKASFLFVGGILPKDIQQELRNAQVCFANVPFVQPDHIHHYYALADVFIFPSLEDEWGIVLNEAAASSLPLVSSIYAGATAEFVQDGINGYTFDPMNKEQCIEVIQRIIVLPEEALHQYGDESFRKAKELDMHHTVDQLQNALEAASG